MRVSTLLALFTQRREWSLALSRYSIIMCWMLYEQNKKEVLEGLNGSLETFLQYNIKWKTIFERVQQPDIILKENPYLMFFKGLYSKQHFSTFSSFYLEIFHIPQLLQSFTVGNYLQLSYLLLLSCLDVHQFKHPELFRVSSILPLLSMFCTHKKA